MPEQQINRIGVILPHQLGKLCLLLRLISAEQKETSSDNVIWEAFAPLNMVSALQQWGLFSAVREYDHESAEISRFDKIIDLTSYEYSNRIAARLKWDSIVRRDLDAPWIIECGRHGAFEYVTCPALEPNSGWFAQNMHSSAMLTELPVLNIGLGRPVNDCGLYLMACASGPMPVWPNPTCQSSHDVLLMPAGAHKAKHYPLEDWIEVAMELENYGRSVMVMLGPDETALLPKFKGEGLDCTVSTELSATFDAVVGSNLIISNDCGPMHLALAFGLPTLAVFGPTLPESWFSVTTRFQRCLQRKDALLHRGQVLSTDDWSIWPSATNVFQYTIELLQDSSSGHPFAFEKACSESIVFVD